MPENTHPFISAYKSKYAHFLQQARARHARTGQSARIGMLRACLVHRIRRPEDAGPIILGNSVHRVSIVSLGTFPPYAHTKQLIYPLGFVSKKRFKPHSGYKKRDGQNGSGAGGREAHGPQGVQEEAARGPRERVLYVCSIDERGPKITAEDGRVWQGSGFWEEFSREVECQEVFSGFEEFSGLSHPAVVKMVEGIGDVKALIGYEKLPDKRI